MRPTQRLVAVASAFGVALATVSMSQNASAAPSPARAEHRAARVCDRPEPGKAMCHAWARTDVGAGAEVGAGTDAARSGPGGRAGAGRPKLPQGYGPGELRSAYNLTAKGSSAQTIAIVDAYDSPTVEQDLAVYRSTYTLPACTTRNGCFRKVDQNGKTRYPRTDAGWALEIALDVQMASAICPDCRILLVEAKSNYLTDLGAAVNRAAAMGATVISNSWGSSDLPDAGYGDYFNHPGIAITASSGDGGYGVSYPASSQYVTAVGGTSLTPATGGTRNWTETAWSGAGSGCSAYNAALPGAATVGTGCDTRAVADVSAVADPYTGVAVYNTTRYGGRSGWFVVGGTSASAPIIAGVYALAGAPGSVGNNGLYAHAGQPSAFNDVTEGTNGTCAPAQPEQLCTARVGWDGPTGLGTPNGTGGFLPGRPA